MVIPAHQLAALLTAEEEVALARAMEAGVLAAEALRCGRRPGGATADELGCLAEAGERARRRYIEANLRLVAMVAAQTRARVGLPEADLFQEGCLGLLIAVQRFDHRRGCRFATYALQWVRAYVGAASARLLGALDLPTSRAAQLRSARGVEAMLIQQLGRQATASEVAAALGRSTEWVSRLLAHEQPQCLEEVGDLAAAEPDQPDPMAGAAVGELLAVLEAAERRVLELRIGVGGEPLSFAETARVLGMSTGRVRRAEQRALERLREVCPQAARMRLAG